MRFPHHLLRASTFRSEPAMAAMAVVAIGMFVGTWVIGPAITHDSADAPVAAKQERATFEDMVARPDPSPYRAATPAFDITATNYAAAAKEKAQAELGGQTADSEAVTETRSVPRAWSRNIPAFDRHRIY
jgi:hypothetical protein